MKGRSQSRAYPSQTLPASDIATACAFSYDVTGSSAAGGAAIGDK